MPFKRALSPVSSRAYVAEEVATVDRWEAIDDDLMVSCCRPRNRQRARSPARPPTLLSLPRDLRRQIIQQLVVVNGNRNTLVTSSNKPPTLSLSSPSVTTLLQTCKMLQEDTMSFMEGGGIILSGRGIFRKSLRKQFPEQVLASVVRLELNISDLGLTPPAKLTPPAHLQMVFPHLKKIHVSAGTVAVYGNWFREVADSARGFLPRFYAGQLEEGPEDYFVRRVIEVLFRVATGSKWLEALDEKSLPFSLTAEVDLERADDMLHVIWDVWEHMLVLKESRPKL